MTIVECSETVEGWCLNLSLSKWKLSADGNSGGTVNVLNIQVTSAR